MAMTDLHFSAEEKMRGHHSGPGECRKLTWETITVRIEIRGIPHLSTKTRTLGDMGHP